ncbi:ABC transporter substrate-binding protein [Segeticoccus rhizosphaerae]|uniref:ABC transporter substrate-binding protein n=1 Tax=Segeticoccus rhizosphaerae TaxID=1104777 RepID=UPI0010C0F85D|nr:MULTISPECIES: ABC transporter substrate-binding protein [Intrasporangiaceae]
MPRPRHALLLTMTLALGLGAAGCSQPTGSTPAGTGGDTGGGDSSAAPASGAAAHEGGNLTVALAEAPDALDPTVASTYVGRIVFANMCEKLYDVGDGLKIVPQLAAEKPKVSPDGKTYTIVLRKGVKFNDGTDFNAQAVKKTLEHYKDDPKSARASELTTVTKVDAVNPTTVRLHLKTPYAPLTAILADRSGMILSPKQLDKLGDDFAKHPVCVGPFSFKDRPSSDKIELTRSKYYYDKAKVHLDGVTFVAVTQPNVRAANLRSGDIDVADRIAPPDVATLKGSSDVKVWPVTSLGYQGLTINVSNSAGAGKPGNHTVDNPMAQHPELRQALALSLDRDAINKVVFQGQYVPGCTPISPESPFAPDITCPKRDVAKAKQLVADSGVPTPIPVQVNVQAGNADATKLGTVIQSMAKDAGFDVKVNPIEFTTALDNAAKGNFETFQVGWSGRLDPDQNIAPFWDNDSALNYSGANYKDVQSLIQKEQSTTDEAARKQVFQQLAESFLQHNNIIYLYYPKVVMGYRSAVSGIQYYGDGLIRLKSASISGS